MRRILLFAALAVLPACLGMSACGNDVMREMERAEQRAIEDAEHVVTSSEAFLTEAAARQGASTLPSGLVFVVSSRGEDQSLPKPGPDAFVLVHYEGKLPNGEIFDSSFERGQPAEFGLSDVVPGFSEAITQMRPGDEIIAFLPAALGYGARGSPPDIPANSALQFRIKLLAYQDARGRVVRAPGE